MTSAAVIIGDQCRYCQKWYPKGSLIRFGPGLERCQKCEEQHLKALDVLAGKATPEECAACHVRWATLCERQPGEHVAMYVHMIDGLYGVLCEKCDRIMVRWQAQLYRGTPFGKERKL